MQEPLSSNPPKDIQELLLHQWHGRQILQNNVLRCPIFGGIRMASFSFFRTTLINTVLFPAKFRSVTMNKNSKYESGKFINESG